MFLGSFDLARIVGSPLGMAAQVSPAAKAAQMSPANQVFGAVTGGDAIQNALSSLPAQQALSSSPGIDFNNPVRGAAQGAVGGGILENKLGLEFLKNIFDRGNLESPPMPQQRVIQNAPMQQFNNPYEWFTKISWSNFRRRKKFYHTTNATTNATTAIDNTHRLNIR